MKKVENLPPWVAIREGLKVPSWSLHYIIAVSDVFGEQGHQEGLTQCNATKKVSSKEGPKVELPPRAVSDRCECGGGGRTMQP